MIKKFKRRNKIKPYYPNTELEGHIFSLGKIGGGKSVSTKSVLEAYKDNLDYKIFDLFGGERNEGLYWCLPSNEEGYWNTFKNIGKFDEEGPKQYRVNLLYPYFKKNFPTKLPSKEKNVRSKIFTISLKDITLEDIKMVIGNISDTGKYIWNELLEKSKRKDNSGSVINICEDIKGAKSSIIYKNFILPMHREQILSSHYFDYNLDLIEEAKDKEAITVLCLDFVNEKYHLFIINYVIKKLTELIDSNLIHKKNILFIREAATFFRATEDSVLEDKYKIFRTNMSHYIRMGRRGTHFALDCQSSAEVKGLVQGSEDYLLMFRTTSWRDKNDMCDELKKERRMSPIQVADLAFLEKGECYIAESGKVVKKVKLTLSRSDFWKKEYGNFYKNTWIKNNGNWTNTLEIKDMIEKECNNMYLSTKKDTTKKKVIIKDINQLVDVEKLNVPKLQQMEELPLPA